MAALGAVVTGDGCDPAMRAALLASPPTATAPEPGTLPSFPSRFTLPPVRVPTGPDCSNTGSCQLAFTPFCDAYFRDCEANGDCTLKLLGLFLGDALTGANGVKCAVCSPTAASYCWAHRPATPATPTAYPSSYASSYPT
eukprot:gene25066-3715_t